MGDRRELHGAGRARAALSPARGETGHAMHLDAGLKGLVAAAHERGLPVALWRAPGGPFRAMISTDPAPAPRPVFGGGAAQPFFAMQRFDTADANLAEAVPGDILAELGLTRFFDGRGYAARPETAAQAALLEAAPGGPVRAAEGPRPAETGRAEYEALVVRARERIAEGACRKIVLSRAVSRALPAGHDLIDVCHRLAGIHRQAFVALVSAPATGTWLVATPETLLRAEETRLSTMALAGTQWPAPGTDPRVLDWPAAVVEEQRLVAEDIRRAFASAGIGKVAETPARGVAAGPLCHLRSDFSAALDDAGGLALAALLRQLHPTAAVCGAPRAAARAFLREAEGYDRRFYTGFLGAVGLDGRTELFVNLRSAEAIGDRLCLYVGGGIVAGSDPAREWQETVEKTRVIAAAL